MRPLQGRESNATFSGGVAPGYYLVPLQGTNELPPSGDSFLRSRQSEHLLLSSWGASGSVSRSAALSVALSSRALCCHPEEVAPAKRREYLRISRPRVQRFSHFLPHTCWFRPELPRNLCIFGQKVGSIVVHFVALTFVFIHIARSTFIFNISWGQRPVPDLDQRVGRPPQLAQAGFILCMNIAFSPFEAIRMVRFSGDK